MSRRHWSDLLLFAVTGIELTILLVLTPALLVPDWIYVVQHLMVLGIALTRGPAAVEDHSARANVAVAVAYGYPYAQIIYLQQVPGVSLWPAAGMVLITCGAVLSFLSLSSIGRRFGVRPALRGLSARGTYALVRHPMYLSYLLGDIGYNLQEANVATIALVLAGWVALVYRIRSEERVMAHHPRWHDYVHAVRYRLVPGIW